MLAGAAVLMAGTPLFAQYAGPAILARGEAPAAMSGPAISFRPSVQFSGVYDTGLAGPRLTDSGDLATEAAFGGRVTVGVSGTHGWKRSQLGLSYRGSYTNYGKQYVVGLKNYSYDQSFLLGLTHRVSRHTSLSIRQSMGLFTRDFGLAGLAQTVPFDPAESYIPTTDFFDNRTMYLTTQADLSFQLSRRLSADIGGGRFINRRLSTSLFGSVGTLAHGDMHYRLSRSTTIGVVYNYNQYHYTRVFGGTDTHTIAGSFSMRPSRWLEFSAAAGLSSLESTFLHATLLDPVIADLLGISRAVQIVHTKNRRPYLSARLSRTFHRGVVYVSGGNSITPGNGIFLTSMTTTMMAGYGYTGLRRWSMGAQAGRTWSESIGTVSGGYGGTTATVNVSRQIVRSTHFTFNLAMRKYSSPDFDKYNRLIYTATVGIGFTPGNIPLRIW